MQVCFIQSYLPWWFKQKKKKKQKLRSSGQLVRLLVFYFNFYCSDFKCVYLLNHISGRFCPMLRFEEEVQGNVLFKLWMDCISYSIIFILLSCIFYLIHGIFCHFVLHILLFMFKRFTELFSIVFIKTYSPLINIFISSINLMDFISSTYLK